MGKVSAGLTIDADAMQANRDATDGAVLAERATFLLAEKMGKQKAGKLVEQALAKGGFVCRGALGQLETELADTFARPIMRTYPIFLDRQATSLENSDHVQFPTPCRRARVSRRTTGRRTGLPRPRRWLIERRLLQRTQLGILRP
jgi:hypothetical protein